MFGNRGFEVYVGDLDPSVTEQLLYNSFAQFGMISSVKIMRHIVTHKSRGFGFVTFFHQSDGQRAIKEMHKSTLLNACIKVYSKTKFNSIDRNSNLLILNLPLEYGVSDIRKMTVNYGGVFSIEVKSQEFEQEEAPNRVVSTRRRAYLQFEKISDALNFKKEFHNTTVQENDLVIVFTHLNHILSMKGSVKEDMEEELKNSLAPYGKFKVLEIKTMKNKPDYIATVEFENSENAREVYLTFRINKSAFPFVTCLEPIQNQKRGFNKNMRRDRKYYCKIYLPSEVDVTSYNDQIAQNYQDFISGIVSRDDSDKVVYEILFGNTKALAKFIFELENGKSCLKDLFSNKKPEIEYPRFLIKSLKANRWNKSNPRKPQMFGNNNNPMFQMNQFGGQMNPMQMRYMMMMQMNMMNYNMMNQNMMNPGMMNPNMMNPGMMNPNMMNPNMMNPNMMNPNMMNPNMMNPNMQGMTSMPEISGLEVILGDIEGFKSKEKEEQNKILMNVMQKKILACGNNRANDPEFMKLVGDFFLDDSVLDIDERLTILSDNKKILDFLNEVLKE